MVRGTAVLREGLNCSREAARTSVSGICVADESQRKAIPAARLATPTVSRSEVMVNGASRGLKPPRGRHCAWLRLWAVHATKRV